MGEKKNIIEGITVSYNGYFNANELYQVINNFIGERGYDRFDKLHEVQVTEKGRNIILDLQPTKSISDYIKVRIVIKAALKNITDEVIELDGKQMKVNKGSVKIALTGLYFTDYEGDWYSNPKRLLLKVIFDKFVYKGHLKDAAADLKGDVMRLRNEISAFLNLNKYIKS